jgi:hypothetical protein
MKAREQRASNTHTSGKAWEEMGQAPPMREAEMWESCCRQGEPEVGGRCVWGHQEGEMRVPTAGVGRVPPTHPLFPLTVLSLRS